jgi:protein-tyrosine-phosphatase
MREDSMERSQMADTFAKKYGEDKFITSSAGNILADRVNPMVVEVMKEKLSILPSAGFVASAQSNVPPRQLAILSHRGQRRS